MTTAGPILGSRSCGKIMGRYLDSLRRAEAEPGCGRISKIGDSSVRAALYEAAHIILTKPLKGCTALKSWAMRIARRAGMSEGVILGQDGVADFERLHSGRHDNEVQLLGFDLLELDGDELRGEPLDRRKAALAKLLRRATAGIQFVEHLEQPGDVVFAQICKLPASLAVRREAEEDWGR